MKLLRQPKRVRSDMQARRKSVITGKNLSQFYSNIYAGLFGGRVNPPYRSDVDRIGNGEPRFFRPDVVRDRRQGSLYTEVKATSTRRSNYFCRVKQFENMCYNVLNSKRCAYGQYAFFQYRTPRREEGIDELTNEDVVRKLAANTRYMILAPLNVAMYMFMFTPRTVMNHQTSDGTPVEAYWVIGGGKTIALAEGGIAGLKKEYEASAIGNEKFKRSLAEEMLALDDVVEEAYMSNDIAGMRICGHEMNPFPIARYSMPPKRYERWLTNVFRRHHKELLSDGLWCNDLFEEQKSLPF